MKLKKVVANVLAMVMFGSMVTGCSTGSISTVETKVVETEMAETKTTEAKETEAKVEETKSDEPVEFTYWLPLNINTAKAYTDHNEHPGAIRIEEQTGVKVDYVSPPVGQEREQMNLLLATGEDMPDLFRWDLNVEYRGGVEGAIADGVIIDATELIEEYAPNFMAIINSNENMKRGAYTDGGVMAYFGAALTAADYTGYGFCGPMVSKTMLDKVGLDVPVTIADWEEMLAAFKELGVIPFSVGGNNTLDFNCCYNAFASAYGVPMGAQFMNEEGTVKFGPMEPGYKDFLTLFHKWYENGWLDPDFLSKNPDKEVKNDFEAALIGSTVRHMNSINSSALITEQLGKEVNQVVAAPYPVLNEGDQIHFRKYVLDFNAQPAFISASAEDPIAIIKWMDYLYSEEGILELAWGVKDDDRFEDTYYVGEDGERYYTDFVLNNPDITEEEVLRQYLLRDTITVWRRDFQTARISEKDWETIDVWATTDYDYCMPQTLTMTLDESTTYTKLMGDITTYVTEMTAKYIMGIESLDDYDKFIATLEKMNIAEVTEIQQNALNRYLAR